MMEQKMEYDVFISSRSYDYNMAKEVRSFLESKGLKVFFSEFGIDEKGQSYYEETIANALRDSANMIVVCSNASYVHKNLNEDSSEWVYYEWSTFHRMMMDKEKPKGADILTIHTSNVSKKDLPQQLRGHQCLTYDEYQDRIMSYLTDNCDSNKNIKAEPRYVTFAGLSGFDEKRAKRNRILIPLLTGLAGLLLGLSFFFINRMNSETPKPSNDQKTLVLAGGGSVVTYLDEKYRGVFNPDSTVNAFEDNQYPNAFYLHVPSESALTLLAEEAIMPNSRDNQPFYPVCFSAEKADSASFLTKCSKEEFLKAGHIVEFKLGEEALAVYVEVAKAPKLNAIVGNEDTMITVKQLVRLLRSGEYNVFSTSKESGTFYAYNAALLKEQFDLGKLTFNKFSNQSDLTMLQKPDPKKPSKPFVLLGGDLYRPKALKDPIKYKTVCKLMLVDDKNKQPIIRPLYVYFLAYNDKKEHFIVPDEILDLLNKIGLVNDGGKYINNETHQLTVLDSQQLIIPIE